MKKYTFFLLFCTLLFSSSVGAQGWEYLFPDANTISFSETIIRTSDGNYLTGGFQSGGSSSSAFGSYVVKLDEAGNTLWQKNLSNNPGSLIDLVELANDRYLVVSPFYSITTDRGPFLRILDDTGTVIWEQHVTTPGNDQIAAIKAIGLDNGGFLLSYQKASTPIFNTYDSNWALVSSITPTFTSDLSRQLPNGNLLWMNTANDNVYSYETDIAGTVVASQTIPWTDPAGTLAYRNGEIFLSTTADDNGTILKMQHRFDASQNLIDTDTIWAGAYAQFYTMEVVADGFLYSGFTGFTPDPTNGIGLIIKTDFDGNVIFTKQTDHRPEPSTFRKTVASHTTGYLAAGAYGTATASYVIKLDENGFLFNNQLSGIVVVDDLPDCIAIPGETPVSGWALTATKNGGPEILVAITDDNGAYQTELDTGVFVLSLQPINNYWNVCTNDVVIDFTANDQSIVQDFAIETGIECPAMQIEAGTFVGQPCVTQPIYLSYCNEGTITATDAYIEVTLDTAFTVISSTLPWTSISADNVVTFDLGDVGPFDCDDITLMVELSCAADWGLGYLIDAHIYPDSICGAVDPQYSGAFLASDGLCDADNIFFEIKNVGEEPMDVSAEFFIVEDAVLMMVDNIPVLSPQESFPITIPANGSTYALIHDQVPFAPGESMPIQIVQACGTDIGGEYSTGFSNQFPLDDRDIFVDVDYATASETPAAPNALHTAPKGYGLQHLIEPNTPIEYSINFQNLNTALVEDVVIRIPLAPETDVKTLKLGVASHDFQFRVEANNTLVFDFEDIQLPTSSTDEQGSKGFVSFTIRPQADLALGTVVRQQASIVFDDAPALMTEEIFHTIGQDFLEVIIVDVTHPVLDNVKISVHPNPIVDQAFFDIQNHESDRYELEIFDVRGAKVSQETFTQEAVSIRRGQLPAGFYIYRLSSEDGLESTGKLMVK